MRYPEIDLARLLAMLMMAVYHTAFDLSHFYRWDLDLGAGAWRLLQRSTLLLFLLLVGVSAILLRQNLVRFNQPVVPRFTRRGLALLGWAMTITFATYVMNPNTFIRFGVLHCIAVATFLLPFLLPFGLWNVLIGAAIIFVGSTIEGRTVPTSLLLPLGLVPANFASLDYVPLLPNLGVILLGAALGQLLYVRELRPAWRFPPWAHRLSAPGRYALAFYLLHQPIILSILSLFLGQPTF